MNAAYEKLLGGRSGLIGLLILGVLLLVIFPLGLDIFRLNLVGKYLSYAFVAVGLVLCWGYGGILSLGQGVFFGVGGYCMAMFLKLEASDPISTKIQSTPGIPDFMDWNQITSLPTMWQPFHSFSFTVLAVLAVPTLLALIIGMAMFKRRVGDVYFSIVTQAIAAILSILIIGQQGLTGGVNGITDLKTLMGWDIRTDSAKVILYFVNAGLLFACILFGRYILTSKLGRLLMAMRDKEERVRFSGYDVASFKVFVFCVAAMFSAIGGAMFTLQVGFMSPSFVGIVPSIEMVIYAAVGGRMSLLGAVYGTLLVNFGKTYFSETFPELWLFLMGGLFIAVVMYFPNGLAGVYEKQGKRLMEKFSRKPKKAAEPDAAKPKAATKPDSTEISIDGANLEASK
ncbi:MULTISPECIES: urea ABC transporter permease subunit UrtC [unclassified Herbaspirillum]|uniref:urea ABC transporter permease subunit UrtC n=1 Tax=unclassified Herbaspirillum TaxID=2624150 RepID=UPI000E2FBDE2|nr:MULTISPECIES: urea ABC transporter permease subunit UrtC [unclassified Herbaspirillum]RFB67936.1 urea ABC transporter permease subunit UrtC [Herbaspirillum sp. 3R-3a1]TFI06374.1 urea ABC transporter permease subunit UrtC [Herbaspirillum sp. 3R11]TFI14014.1 urea ABC transporter permease subunit UrtC [Herbaspirillum sp. 3R-11]TFI25215.1 urea ABC transporter permease subunit UrtC [Herbaspirillum sp. 3C11]